ncbi:MAG: hypothetical protein ACYC8T_30920 [Myxococcaceae bacterium]
MSLGASVNGGYQLHSASFGGAPVDSVPAWTWGASLGLVGGGLNPELMTWRASGNYQALRTFTSQSSSALDNLGFDLGAELIPSSPLPIALFASRTFIDASEVSATSGYTGATRQTGFGGTARFRHEGLPSLSLGLSRSIGESQPLGMSPLFTSSTHLTTRATGTGERSSYAVDYGTSWNSGTNAETNYQTHRVGLGLSSEDNGRRFYLSERYGLRLPTVTAAFNPRLDDNNLTAGLQFRPDARLSSQLSYSYNRSLFDDPSGAGAEIDGQGLALAGRYVWRPDLEATAGAGVNYASARSGALSSRGVGETLNAGLDWTRALPFGFLRLGGNGSAGLVEPSTGGVGFSGGLGAHVASTWTARAASGSVQYDLSYSSGGAGVEGYTYSQGLHANALSPLGRFGQVSGMLSGAISQRVDRVFGSSASRSASLVLSWSARRLSASLSAGISDGLSAALGGGGVPLPTQFNTRTLYASASANLSLRWVVLSAYATASDVAEPGRAGRMERSGAVVLSTFVGKFTASLEDRYSEGGSGALIQRTNLFMARLTRSFDLRF